MKSVSVSGYARLRASSRLEQFLTRRQYAEGKLHDADAIHDLRVSIRRLAQCLRTFRGVLAPLPARKMRKGLRRLMALCAAVRNCDVAIEVLQQAGAIDNQRKSRLLSARRDAERALQEHLTDGCRWRKRKWLKLLRISAQKGAEWVPGESVQVNLSTMLPALTDEFFEKGRTAKKNSDLESWHEFRLHAKRFRYTLELFRRFYGSEMIRCLQDLRELQEHLGGINDCMTTVSMLKEDREAAAAVHCLLGEREARFRRYWRYYSARLQERWKNWMRQPISVTK